MSYRVLHVFSNVGLTMMIRRASVVTFGIVILIVVVMIKAINPDTHQVSPDPIEDALLKWQGQSIDSYQMTVFSVSPPASPVGLELKVQQGELVDEKIIACEHPSEDYPEQWCEPTRTYYAYTARITIDDLFEASEQCLERTRQILKDCPALSENFRHFEDRDEMYQIADQCSAYISDFSNALCTVQFNSTYGYPEHYYSLVPNTIDGGGAISIRDFRITD